jgi:hypothetical protein
MKEGHPKVQILSNRVPRRTPSGKIIPWKPGWEVVGGGDESETIAIKYKGTTIQ